MAERLDIVSQSNFPTNKSNTVEIVTTTKKKVTTASASDIATLVTPAISNLDIATQTNFPIQESDAQSDFIITTDGGVSNVTAEAAAGLISSYIPTGGGDPHEPDFTEDYSTNYSDFSNFTGSGTEADPYQIWNEKMFLNARFKVNNGGLSQSTYFKQMRDIVWQFDGYGWGTYAGVYIYTEDYSSMDTFSYGTEDYKYINYNGGNCKLFVDLSNFSYTDDFYKELFGVPSTGYNSYPSSWIDGTVFALFRVCNISFLHIKFSSKINKPTSQNYGMPSDGVYCIIAGTETSGYTGKALNCTIEGLYCTTQDTNYFYTFFHTYNKLGCENCTLKDITLYRGIRCFYSTYDEDTDTSFRNCTLDNYNIVYDADNNLIFYNYGKGGIDLCTAKNLRIANRNRQLKIFYAYSITNCVLENCHTETGSVDVFSFHRAFNDKYTTCKGNYLRGHIYHLISNTWDEYYVINGESDNMYLTASYNVNQGLIEFHCADGITFDNTKCKFIKSYTNTTASNNTPGNLIDN